MMQSGGGGSGNGRNPTPPLPSSRPLSSSSVMLPSSSSALSTQGHLGLKSIHQLQQQQLAFRLHQQQQHLRKPEGEDSFIAYRSSGMHGATGSTNLPSSSAASPLPQTHRKFDDGLAQLQDENHSHVQVPHEMQNPVQQAYLQFALQAAQQNYHGNLLAQQQVKVGLAGPTGRDQDTHLNNLKMQDLISLQTANQTHATVF
ncbi:hypothetical protein HPP92_025792 [Vanilla planifolia]|nr:hypothetical protein HPP92_025792 [Vanilla planifolia]